MISQEHLPADSQANIVSGTRDRFITERGLTHQLELNVKLLDCG